MNDIESKLEKKLKEVLGATFKPEDVENFIDPLRRKYGPYLSPLDLESHFLPKLNSLKLLCDKMGETSGSI